MDNNVDSKPFTFMGYSAIYKNVYLTHYIKISRFYTVNKKKNSFILMYWKKHHSEENWKLEYATDKMCDVSFAEKKKQMMMKRREKKNSL